jgi:hypothetical protein
MTARRPFVPFPFISRAATTALVLLCLGTVLQYSAVHPGHGILVRAAKEEDNYLDPVIVEFDYGAPPDAEEDDGSLDGLRPDSETKPGVSTGGGKNPGNDGKGDNDTGGDTTDTTGQEGQEGQKGQDTNGKPHKTAKNEPVKNAAAADDDDDMMKNNDTTPADDKDNAASVADTMNTDDTTVDGAVVIDQGVAIVPAASSIVVTAPPDTALPPVPEIIMNSTGPAGVDMPAAGTGGLDPVVISAPVPSSGVALACGSAVALMLLLTAV